MNCIRVSAEHSGVGISLGGATHVIGKEEALQLAADLQTVLQTHLQEDAGEQAWYIMAGKPGVHVKTEVSDFETLRRNCLRYARDHKAAVWAIAASQVTGVLAWPVYTDAEGRFPPTRKGMKS